MAKTTTRYGKGYKNEIHSMPHGKPKRERKVQDIQDIQDIDIDSVTFHIDIKIAHIIAMILTAFCPLGIGWKLAILSFTFISTMSAEMKEEE